MGRERQACRLPCDVKRTPSQRGNSLRLHMGAPTVVIPLTESQMRPTPMVACVAVVGVLAAGGTKEFLPVTAIVPITITVVCTETQFTVDVSPFVAQVPEGSEIGWTLVSANPTAEIDV